MVDMPDYEYPLNIACPTCYKPLNSLKRSDARCDECLRSKDVLPINRIRPPKKKETEEEREERRSYRHWDEEFDE